MGDIRMGADNASLAELVAEVRRAAADMSDGDARTNARIDAIEKSLNALMVKVQRPGALMTASDDEALERKEASDYCVLRRNITVPKSDGNNIIYMPSSTEIDEAITARRGQAQLTRIIE